MTPVIRIDDEVMSELKKRAIDLGLVFEPPNATLRRVLGLDTKGLTKEVVANAIELELNASSRKYVLIPVPKDKRRFFPGYKVSFELKTDDAGVFTAHITSAPGRPPRGDLDAGGQIRGRFGQWYVRHPELKAGDKVRIEALEPGKRYKLSTPDNIVGADKKTMVDSIVKEAINRYKSKS
jgi:hypothetical protein